MSATQRTLASAAAAAALGSAAIPRERTTHYSVMLVAMIMIHMRRLSCDVRVVHSLRGRHRCGSKNTVRRRSG